MRKGYGMDLCPECGGEGRHTTTRRGPFGTFTSSTPCHRCGGSGEINTHPCPNCEGRGAKRINDELEINIPPGVSSGDRIRMAGKGEAGTHGGPTGDLYVQIVVEEHPVFKRDGEDLLAAVGVSMAEAALGTDVVIPTLDGEESLHVPAGSQPGEVFKLKGKGMPRLNSNARGDMHLHLEVEIPHKLNAEQRRLLEEYRRVEERRKNSPKLVDRLRKAMKQQL